MADRNVTVALAKSVAQEVGRSGVTITSFADAQATV